MVAAVLFTQAISATDAHAASQDRSDYVTSGDFRTLATVWNVAAGGLFRCPEGATIRVRYGVWFEKNRQVQNLDCANVKSLEISKQWSKLRAKIQIKVPTSQYVSWTYFPIGPPQLPDPPGQP